MRVITTLFTGNFLLLVDFLIKIFTRFFISFSLSTFDFRHADDVYIRLKCYEYWSVELNSDQPGKSVRLKFNGLNDILSAT